MVVKSSRLGIKIKGKAREREEERYSTSQVFLEAKSNSAVPFFLTLLA